MKLGQDTPNLTTNDGNSTGMDASKDISPKVMNLGTIATFPPPPIIQVGTGTATSASNTRTPWTTFFEDTRHQYLITAAELAALGLTNGDQLYALAFNVIAVASPNSNVTISMKSTTDTEFTSFTFDNTGFTTVFNGSHTPSIGWDQFIFTTPYTYDGQGIVLNFCINNTVFSGNSSVQYSTTTSSTHRYAYTDNTDGCNLTAFGSNTSRVNMQFSTVPIHPRVTSIVRQNPTTSPTNADMLVWDVTFDMGVNNVDASDFVTTGTTGTITSVTNPSGNVYRVAVSGGNMAGLNGTVTLGFTGGQNITNIAGSALINTTPTGTNNNTFVVDNTVPQITSITRQSPTTSPTNADMLVWDVTFDDAVSNVDVADFAVTGTTATIASVTNPSGNIYRVTVSGGNMAGLNGTVTLGFTGGQNITNIAGNALINTTPTGTNNNTFVVDNTAPQITSITRQSPITSPTNADMLVWDVTFDDAVSNVDVVDFTVTGTTATIASVTNPSGNMYRVTISGGDLASLNSTVTLGFSGTHDITDASGNSLTNLTPTGSNHNTFVVDNTAPRIMSITRQSPTTSPTDADMLVWDVTFDEVASNVDVTDFTVTGTTATITSVTNPSGNVYRVTVSGGNLASLNGTVTLGFTGGQNITDAIGNALTNLIPTGTNNNTFVICSAPNNPVASIMLGTRTTNSIVFTGFTAPVGGATGYIVKINNSNTFTNPSNGATLPATNAIWLGKGEQVIYVGNSTNPMLTVSGLKPGVTYYFKVFAYNNCIGTNKFENIGAAINTITPKANQTITFGTLANQTVGVVPFNLTATASSGLVVTYTSSNTAVATVSGNTITIVGAGTTNITASQAGNANYNAATDVTQGLMVNNVLIPTMVVKEGSNTLLSGNGNYNFGSIDQGQSSALVTFIIENSGAADLVLNGNPIVYLTGANNADFKVTQPTATTIAANGNITFQIVFTPSNVGVRTAMVSITSNDVNNPYTFTLSGESLSKMNNKLAAPNLFSPNGDGNNDTFVISALTLAKVSLKIFSRNGKIVYSSEDIEQVTQIGWDGISKKGVKLPVGTYIWQVTGLYQDGTLVKRKTGEVYLIR